MKTYYVRPSQLLLINLWIIVILLIPHLCFLPGYSSAIDDSSMSVWIRFFNFDHENNLPAAYSSVALALSSVLCWISSCMEGGRKFVRYSWNMMSLIFAFLALDEWKSIHERLSLPAHRFLGIDGLLDSELIGAWVYPYFLIVIVFVLIFFPFFVKLDRTTRKLFVISFCCFVAGSLGAEFLAFQVLKVNRGDLIYLVLGTAEELLEMLGIAIFNYSLLRRIGRSSRVIFHDKPLPSGRL